MPGRVAVAPEKKTTPEKADSEKKTTLKKPAEAVVVEASASIADPVPEKKTTTKKTEATMTANASEKRQKRSL